MGHGRTVRTRLADETNFGVASVRKLGLDWLLLRLAPGGQRSHIHVSRAFQNDSSELPGDHLQGFATGRERCYKE
jgi:hypothetical protein